MSYIYVSDLIRELQLAEIYTPQLRQIIEQLQETDGPAAHFTWDRDDVLAVAREKMRRPTDEQIVEILHDFQGTEWVDKESLAYFFDSVLDNAGHTEPTLDDLIWILQDGYDRFAGGPLATLSDVNERFGYQGEVQVKDGRIYVTPRSWDGPYPFTASAPISPAGDIDWKKWE